MTSLIMSLFHLIVHRLAVGRSIVDVTLFRQYHAQNVELVGSRTASGQSPPPLPAAVLRAADSEQRDTESNQIGREWADSSAESIRSE
jgi:hypothetical protein